jgi:hypothetical protein
MKNIEEVGHEMESLLVLNRDGKLRLTRNDRRDLFGIELLRSLVGVMKRRFRSFQDERKFRQDRYYPIST